MGEMRTVLVVDDDPLILRLMSVVLERAEWTVRSAADGAEALLAATMSPPDVIVSDLMMPKLDGGELIEELRKDPRTAGIPVLIVSAAGDQLERVLRRGAFAALVKPIDPDQLVSTCRAAVDQV
jgi:twitching motility two-component system response regulator PilH